MDPLEFPVPGGHLPWDTPHAPIDLALQANDIITARAELTGRGGETLTAESGPVNRAF